MQQETEKKPTFETSSKLRRVLIGRRPRWTLIRITVLVLVTFVLFKFVFIPVRVEGHSMEPTYHNGRFNLINRLAYLRHEPKRGDVVAIKLAGYRAMLLKRIIGLPGERLTAKRGRVWVDGVRLDEPYLVNRVPWAEGEIVLLKDEFYVVGDNRSVSEHRAVKRDDIVGKAVF